MLTIIGLSQLRSPSLHSLCLLLHQEGTGHDSFCSLGVVGAAAVAAAPLLAPSSGELLVILCLKHPDLPWLEEAYPDESG